MLLRILFLVFFAALALPQAWGDYSRKVDTIYVHRDTMGNIIVNQSQTNIPATPEKEVENSEVISNSDRLGKQIDLLSNFITFGIGFLSILLVVAGFYAVYRLGKIDDKTYKAILRAEETLTRYYKIIEYESEKIQKIVSESEGKSNSIRDLETKLQTIQSAYDNLQNPVLQELITKISSGEEPDSELINKFKAVLSVSQALSNSEEKKSANDYFIESISQGADEKWQDALNSIDKALSLADNNQEYWFWKGYISGKLNRYNEAILAYLKAIELKPDYHEAWNNLGIAYCDKPNPDYDEAIKAYLKAVEIKPDFHEAWNNLGNAYVKKPDTDYDEAIKAYLKAIKFKPDYHEAWYNLGLAYATKPEPEYDKAIKAFLKAIKIKPDFHEGWNNLGNAYFNKPDSDYDEAIKAYLKAIKIKPDFHQAWFNLGNAYVKKPDTDYDEAIKAYLKAIKFKPDYHEAWYNLGNAYGLKPEPDYEKALQAIDKALEFAPDNNFYLKGKAAILARKQAAEGEGEEEA